MDSDFTTPEDLLDDLNDSKYNSDNQFLPDDGKYEVKIISSHLDPRKSYSNDKGSGEIGGRHRLGLQILKGPTQVSGVDPIGKTFFGAEVPIPGGDYFEPRFELYGDYTSIDQVITEAKKKLARFLNTFGWSIEAHGRGFRTDPTVFLGMTTVEGATVTTKKYTDKTGEERTRVFFNPPKAKKN